MLSHPQLAQIHDAIGANAMKNKIVYLLGAFAALAFSGTAGASTIYEGTVLLTTNTSVNGHPAYAHNIDANNFNTQTNHSLAGKTLTFSDGSTLTGNSHSQFFKGTNPNNATPFGDNTEYLSIGADNGQGKSGAGEATFTMSHAAHYFGFLWGSVDTYNSLSFYDKLGNKIASFTGADMPTDNGAQNSTGTFYANFTSSVAIWKVVMTSTANAFEVDNIAISAVPLPAALPLFGAALAGMGVMGRRRRAKALRAA